MFSKRTNRLSDKESYNYKPSLSKRKANLLHYNDNDNEVNMMYLLIFKNNLSSIHLNFTKN